jgi:hypothetical protein
MLRNKKGDRLLKKKLFIKLLNILTMRQISRGHGDLTMGFSEYTDHLSENIESNYITIKFG